MAVATKASVKTGEIVQIIGPVLDVRFEEGELPEIYHALTVKRDFPSSKTMIFDGRYDQVAYYPPSIDWIGFGCYGDFWNCNNGGSMYNWRDLAAIRDVASAGVENRQDVAA